MTRAAAKTRHVEVRVTVDGTSAMIDRGIAPLIQLLWENGVRTSESCEGKDDEYAAIYFSEERELTRFVTLAVKHASPALRRRMGLHPDAPSRGGWDYSIYPYQYLMGGGWKDEVFSCVASFPRSDIRLLCRAIEKVSARG